MSALVRFRVGLLLHVQSCFNACFSTFLKTFYFSLEMLACAKICTSPVLMCEIDMTALDLDVKYSLEKDPCARHSSFVHLTTLVC